MAKAFLTGKNEGLPPNRTRPIGCGSKPIGSHFGVGAPVFAYFSGDLDVRWGYDFAVDPWPILKLREAPKEP